MIRKKYELLGHFQKVCEEQVYKISGALILFLDSDIQTFWTR